MKYIDEMTKTLDEVIQELATEAQLAYLETSCKGNVIKILEMIALDRYLGQGKFVEYPFRETLETNLKLHLLYIREYGEYASL